MNTLAELLSSRTRAEIFRLLFGVSGGALHTREIQRRARSSLGAVQQELQKLRRLGLVGAHRDGNRVAYTANRSHPLFPEIHRLVLKTGGLADLLRTALTHPMIEWAFVFGSVARGEEMTESDVDLLVIGDIGLREVANLLSGVAEQIGREINPHVLRRAELLKRKGEKDTFLMRVLAAPKLFVLGDPHDFEAMAR
jgi:predicted nucleotidyltransferase